MTKMIKPKKSKKQPTNARIFFILDRSGSMGRIADETIGGFNAFVESQKNLPGKATLSLVQFDHEYSVVHNNQPIESIPALDKSTFQPRGMTALYDAVGMTISKFKDDNPKDTKTIVAILTDGQENSSKEYSYGRIQELIKEVEGEHNWDVLFIGANMNAQAVAAQMGISAAKSVTYDYNGKGAMDALNTVACATSSLRGMNNMAYADGQALSADSLDMTKLYGSVKANAMKVDSTSDKK